MGNPNLEYGTYQEQQHDHNKNQGTYKQVSGASAVISLLFSLLSIVMIYIGADRKYRCPIEDMIPKFLMTYGSMTLISGIMRFIKYLSSSGSRHDSPLGTLMNSKLAHLVEVLWNIAVFCIFIMGCYYVFKVMADVNGFPREILCDDTVFVLAFSVVVATLGVFAIGILVACCFACFVSVKSDGGD